MRVSVWLGAGHLIQVIGNWLQALRGNFHILIFMAGGGSRRNERQEQENGGRDAKTGFNKAIHGVECAFKTPECRP
ncbi:hypothetical protein GCM10007875_15070 [Limnobacter litoralis]|uniref:Secreted protein n=1 Tax=Limnobacter litoralis TaxID=481366 RepID=A0ABQ5YVC6_9BURK|nr:hypothetical protein GCM10007875_15070 [Limnobacter litoralis]